MCANKTGVFVDGKCDTIYSIHTDPSWVMDDKMDARLALFFVDFLGFTEDLPM